MESFLELLQYIRTGRPSWQSFWGSCLIALVMIGLNFQLGNAAIVKKLPTTTDPSLLAKVFEGFEPEPDYCDVRFIYGWFYWYVDSNRMCTVVVVGNEEEAVRRSQEILENSFSVIISGYGLRE